MNEESPYAPPASDADPPPPAHGPRAEPGQRFVGAIADLLIEAGVSVVLLLGFYFMGVIHGVRDIATLTSGWLLLLVASRFVLLICIQAPFLAATGQTIGKKVARTRIATMDGGKPPIGELIFRRYAFVALIGMVPRIGGILYLVDALFVFRADRRCLHDLIAGTQVLKTVSPEQGSREEPFP